MKKSIVIIPAYNEEKTIGSVVKHVKKFVGRIIVVDDGSIDRTTEMARKAGANVIRNVKNHGVDYASRVGLENAIRMKPNTILFVDADGQLDPNYIPQFLKAIEDGADYVAGWRDLSNYPLDRRIGNWGLTKLSNILCPIGIHDTECGYRAMTLETAKKIKLVGSKYEREMDFVCEIWKNKLKVKEVSIKVPVYYSKPAIKRGIKNFLFLLKKRFYFK